jgi:hypothetical protein
MKLDFKPPLMLIAAAGLCVHGLVATAQEAANSTKAADFAMKEKALQDASKSSAAGPVSGTVMPGTSVNRNKDAGKGAFESEMNLQKNKPSPKVDKNAKASAPMKSISKMTPEERAQLRADVVKEAKP